MAKRVKKYTLIIISLFLFLNFNTTDEHKKEILGHVYNMELLWNKGDLENYMDYYHNSDSLIMQSSNTRFHGWESINTMFVNMFKNENLRGKLHFSEIEIPAHNNNIAVVIGKFNLENPNGNTRNGYFTVVFKRFSKGWKIVHDQS